LFRIQIQVVEAVIINTDGTVVLLLLEIFLIFDFFSNHFARVKFQKMKNSKSVKMKTQEAPRKKLLEKNHNEE
jgi:regulatory protein YycI of two-component signal transduction system YycFG